MSAADAPSTDPGPSKNPCATSYASLRRPGLEDNEFLAIRNGTFAEFPDRITPKINKGRYSFEHSVYVQNADGSDYKIELAIKNKLGADVATIAAELRPDGEAYIEYVWRGEELKDARAAEWLKKKMLEKYSIRKISQVLSETEFDRFERGRLAGETPAKASERTVAYKNCLDLGFTRIEVKAMGNSVELACEK